MATSLSDALANTGMIPPVDAAQLAPKTLDDAKAPANDAKTPDSGMMAQYAKDQENIESARKDRDAAEGSPPKFPTLAPEPKPDTSNDPIKGYTSVIGVLGAIGSMFTRRPMTNTMNAAAASINAMKQGETEDLNRKFDAWKTENDNAFKLLDYQNKIYDTTLKNKNNSVDERISEMQAHAAMFKDDYMMQLAKDRNVVDMEDLQLRRQEAAQKATEYSEKIQEGKEKRDIMEQWTKENPNAPAEKKAAAYNNIMLGKAPPKSSQATMSDTAIAMNGRAVMAGAKPSALGLGYGSNPNKTAVENWISEQDPNFDMAKAEMGYAAGQKELNTVAGASGRIKLAANSLDKAIPLVRDALKKVNLTDLTDLNTVENYLREHTSDPGIAAYNTALQTALSDYASLAMRGTAVTVESREAAKQMIHNNMGNMAIGAVLDQMEKEKTAQKQASAQTEKEIKNESMGKGDTSEPSQEDLEFTAKKYGITVDEVKKRMGEQ